MGSVLRFFLVVALILLATPTASAVLIYQSSIAVANLAGQDGWVGTDSSSLKGVGSNTINASDSGTSDAISRHNISNDGIFQVAFNWSTNSGARDQTTTVVKVVDDSDTELVNLYCKSTDGTYGDVWSTNAADIAGTSCKQSALVPILIKVYDNNNTFELIYNGTSVANQSFTNAGTVTKLYLKGDKDAGALVLNFNNLCVADDTASECFVSPPSQSCNIDCLTQADITTALDCMGARLNVTGNCAGKTLNVSARVFNMSGIYLNYTNGVVRTISGGYFG